MKTKNNSKEKQKGQENKNNSKEEKWDKKHYGIKCWENIFIRLID